jgi:hypothetical protein
MQTPTQSSEPSLNPSSSPSSPASPGPQEQALVLRLFLAAVVNRQAIPPNLAVAVLALSPPYLELLAVKMAELEQADPEVVKAPQPALDSLQKARSVRLSNGSLLAEQLRRATEQQRQALYRKGLEAGLLPLEGLSGPEADKQLPPGVQRDLSTSRKLTKANNKAQATADLKQSLGLMGRG